jgi:ribose/xylose/arabinose/galactoside ABC-type transport system permease subunit
MPSEIKEWNWGAFTFGWLWGVCNGVLVSLLCLIPFVSLVMVFVLGAKGNEWAWQSKRWESIEHFRKTQRTWRNWAIVILVLNFIFVLVLVIAESSTPTSVSPQTM